MCHYLANSGFSCYLGSKSNINYLIKNLNNYIYLDKGYHKNISEKLFKIIKNKNSYVVSLDEEGAIDFPDGSTLLNRYPKQLFQNTELTFMWGKEQYNLVKNNIKNKKDVKITGHPRFEILKKKFHFFYEQESRKILKELKSFHLIAGRFLANPLRLSTPAIFMINPTWTKKLHRLAGYSGLAKL